MSVTEIGEDIVRPQDPEMRFGMAKWEDKSLAETAQEEISPPPSAPVVSDKKKERRVRWLNPVTGKKELRFQTEIDLIERQVSPAMTEEAILKAAADIQARKKKYSSDHQIHMHTPYAETEERPPEQRPMMVMPFDPAIAAELFKGDPREREKPKKGLDSRKAEELTFQNEPITIRISPSQGKYKSPTQFCAVNGRGNMLVDGKWLMVRELPRGVNVTTRRHCAENLARARRDEYDVDYRTIPGSDPVNEVKTYTYPVVPFSVIEDKSPRGAAWFEAVTRTR